MELNSQINTFNSGMDLDTDITLLQEGKYRIAQNVRILTDNNGTGSALQNIEDIRKYEGGLDSSNIILGTAVMKYYNETKKKIEDCGVVFSKVYDNNYKQNINELWLVTNFDTTRPTWKKIVRAILNIEDKVSIVTNYESQEVNNVYITDGNSSIKAINVQKDYNPDNSTIEENSYFDILPNVVVTPFKLKGFSQGNLSCGTVQYCYQLFNVHGTESVTAPMSGLINLYSEDSRNLKSVNGNYKEDNSNKGCIIETQILNANFDRIRIIRIQYEDNFSTPTIGIIDELDLQNLVDDKITFQYLDSGSQYNKILTLEEFNNLMPYEFSAKSLAKLNNIMFASNITENTWDVDYDARAFRCDSNGNFLLQSSGKKDISFSINELNNIEIPEDFDCINPTNSELIYDDKYVFGYDTNCVYRGGIGKNIRYRFVNTTLIESDAEVPNKDGRDYIKFDLELNSWATSVSQMVMKSPEDDSIIDTIDTNLNNKVVFNYSDPYFVSNFLGYQRDETYRFGIIFYNKKSIPSPVHWIGDIRFPDVNTAGYNTFTFGDTVNGRKYELTSHPLGIQFEVNNLPNEVVSYEIVRCKRTANDRTVLTQGLLNKTVYFTGWDSENINSSSYNQYSVGTKDRRPTLIPSFSCMRYFDTGSLTNFKGKQNSKDSDGICNFISSDISFLKDKSVQLIKENYKVVPLYTTCCATYLYNKDKKEYSPAIAIPFGKYMGTTEVVNLEDKNVFGFIFDSANYYPSEYVADGVFGKNEISGGVCKYYINSNYKEIKFNENGRYEMPKFFNVEDSIYATNISPYIQDLKDIKSNINYIGNCCYVNCSVGAENNYGPGGICVALKVKDSNNYGIIGYSSASNKQYIYNDFMKRGALMTNIKHMTTQYGGNTYFNRQNSTYISTKDFNIKDKKTSICFGGDTYLGVLDYANTLLQTQNDENKDKNSKRYVSCYIPMESQFNVYLRIDEHFSQDTQSYTSGIYINNTSANIYFLTEPGTLNSFYTQKYPMYYYNSAYSTQDNTKTYVAKSIYAEDNMQNLNRIVASEVKTNNELSDSWTKFKFANYLDVDSQYGQITNLKVFKNRLYYFQDSAVGIASVNERSLISDNNVGTLVLGTGGILARFDYLVTLNGDSIVNDKSIVNSENTIYWYDLDKNVICSLGNGFSELSKTGKVQSYLNRIHLQARDNAVSFYDKKYNEVWFKIYDRALIFNEQLNVFTSFYTHNPNWFFPLSTKLVTIKDNNCYYLHNMYEADSNMKEDKISFVQFVVNKDVAYTKVFDNQLFSADIKNNNGEDIKKVFKSIYFKTYNQETEPINYDNIDYREDTFRFAISREKSTEDNMTYPGRMRGKYLICNYEFDCNDKNFKLPYLKTTYRYSMI